MKTFKLHWISDPKPQIVTGPDIATAMNCAGIGAGAIPALDYWEEVKTLQEGRKMTREDIEVLKRVVAFAKNCQYSPEQERMIFQAETILTNFVPRGEVGELFSDDEIEGIRFLANNKRHKLSCLESQMPQSNKRQFENKREAIKRLDLMRRIEKKAENIQEFRRKSNPSTEEGK